MCGCVLSHTLHVAWPLWLACLHVCHWSLGCRGTPIPMSLCVQCVCLCLMFVCAMCVTQVHMGPGRVVCECVHVHVCSFPCTFHGLVCVPLACATWDFSGV